MKLIIDISEGIYKHVDTIQNGSIGAKQIINSVKNGIPAYKTMPLAEPCEDAISRQAVLDLIVANHTELNGLNVVMYSPLYKDITQLPFVNPQEPKTGHWIERRSRATGHIESVCSECGAEEGSPYNDYCGNCGARMIEP